jgi:glycopeptide antibiotics resistance protein
VTARRVVAGLLAGYLVVVAWIVFWPSADPASSSVIWMTGVLAGLGAPGWVDATVVEFLANVAMFVPLTFLGSLLRPGWWGWVLVGFAATAGIELVQLVVLSDRSATAVDVAANTLGAVLGASLATAIPARNRNVSR